MFCDLLSFYSDVGGIQCYLLWWRSPDLYLAVRGQWIPPSRVCGGSIVFPSCVTFQPIPLPSPDAEEATHDRSLGCHADRGERTWLKWLHSTEIFHSNHFNVLAHNLRHISDTMADSPVIYYTYVRRCCTIQHSTALYVGMVVLVVCML